MALNIDLCCLEWCRGVVVKHVNSQYRGVSSISPRDTFKTPLVMKATGNYLMNSISLEKTQSLVSGFRYARNRECDAVCHFVFQPSVKR